MKRSTLITLVFLAVVGTVVVWTTLRAQVAECEVCVAFNGQRRCATASAESEQAAADRAQTQACGPLAGGMNDAIACQSRLPVARSCRMK